MHRSWFYSPDLIVLNYHLSLLIPRTTTNRDGTQFKLVRVATWHLVGVGWGRELSFLTGDQLAKGNLGRSFSVCTCIVHAKLRSCWIGRPAGTERSSLLFCCSDAGDEVGVAIARGRRRYSLIYCHAELDTWRKQKTPAEDGSFPRRKKKQFPFLRDITSKKETAQIQEMYSSHACLRVHQVAKHAKASTSSSVRPPCPHHLGIFFRNVEVGLPAPAAVHTIRRKENYVRDAPVRLLLLLELPRVCRQTKLPLFARVCLIPHPSPLTPLLSPMLGRLVWHWKHRPPETIPRSRAVKKTAVKRAIQVMRQSWRNMLLLTPQKPTIRKVARPACRNNSTPQGAVTVHLGHTSVRCSARC